MELKEAGVGLVSLLQGICSDHQGIRRTMQGAWGRWERSLGPGRRAGSLVQALKRSLK